MDIKGLKPLERPDLVPRGKYKPVALQLIKQFMNMKDKPEWAEIQATYSSKNEMHRFYEAFKDVVKKNSYKCWIHMRKGKLYLRRTD